MRTLVIGDIHGAYKALEQCLSRSLFDRNTDRLVCLGDIVDGFAETKACVDELIKLKNCYICLGNHDFWFNQFLGNGYAEPCWLKQGGVATLESYGGIMNLDVPDEHRRFLNSWHPFIVIDEQLFVHGGIDHQRSLEEQNLDDLIWNRQMLETAWKKTVRNQSYKFGSWDNIFVGHTTTQCFGIWDGTRVTEKRPTVPLHLCNVWALDTGAGWDGKLTIMDIDTKEYWQSDLVLNLYPGMGRGLRFNE